MDLSCFDHAHHHRRPVVVSALLVLGVLAMVLAPAPAADARPGVDPRRASAQHEVWSMDQGTDLIHVYSSRGYREVAAIDVSPAALRAAGFTPASASASTVPHMIEFDGRFRYAFVAATAGASTIVIDAVRKEVVAVLATGAGSHMAAVTPDDSAVWIAAIGSQELVEIPLDLDARRPTFRIGARLEVADLLAPIEAAEGWDFPSYSPICQQYSPDSREAWVTLGPGWSEGGLFVLDLDTHEVSAAWDPTVVRANCGVSVTEDRAIANFSGQVVAGDDTEGEWYVFDRQAKAHLATRSAEGLDAHGVRLSPDGSAYWMVNRASDDGLVIDADTLEVVDRVEGLADTPDILDYAPRGETVYVTQRGPNPRSGAIHAASGSQPGLAVIDTATRTTVTVLEPPTVRDAEGRVLNDVHGVGVRPVAPGEPAVVRALARRAPVVPAAALGTAAFTCGLPS